MKVLIISSSPNHEGLTAACVAAAADGITIGSGKSEEIRLTDMKIGNCEQCNNGWGTCLQEHRCQVEDDFQALHELVVNTDAIVLITPVYWGEMSESAKAFTDRLRRCEATLEAESGLKGKPVLAIAAAGGSGNGAISCLASMERWIEHVRARKYDFITVTRWTREYKLLTIRNAALTMLQGKV
jgi:multimeric flavodoxin WrbA